MKKSRILALASVAMLAACTKAITPAHEVFHLQEDYAAAVANEKTYDALPDCDTTTGAATCSDADMRAKLARLDKGAADAIAVAKSGSQTKGYPKASFEADLDAAHASISAFEDLSDALMPAK